MSHGHRKTPTRLLGLLLIALLVLGAASCGNAAEAGMTHTADTSEQLRTAKPFDRAFVDEMVPHHAGAVKMAEVLLESTDDAELRKLAQGIIATQEREIEAMNEFRTERYGAAVPEKGGAGEDHGAGHSG